MRQTVTTILDVLAAALIVAGCVLVSVPLALIVAGCLVGFISWRQA